MNHATPHPDNRESENAAAPCGEGSRAGKRDGQARRARQDVRRGLRSDLDRQQVERVDAVGIEGGVGVVRELGAGVRCLLHTSRAEGAGRIVRAAALAHAWRINAFLPFPEERYRRDFADEASAETLSRQIWAARHVEEIDGERTL